MPRQHLASQVPPASSLLQQLDALAGLHERIRAGQPASVTNMPVRGGDLEPGADLFSHEYGYMVSQPSPAGDCAVAVWALGHPDYTYGSVGAQIVGLDTNRAGLSWPQAQTPPRFCRTAWSSCGRYCACLSTPSPYHCNAAPTPSDLIAAIFDRQQGCWLADLQVQGVKPDPEMSISFSDGSPPYVAASCRNGRETADRALLVFQVGAPSTCIIPIVRLHQFYWLPGSLALALLRTLPASVARVDLQALSASQTSLGWKPLSECCVRPVMAVSPDGQTIWVAHHIREDELQFCASVHSAADLVCQGSWTLPKPVPHDIFHHEIVIQVAQRSIAFSMDPAYSNQVAGCLRFCAEWAAHH